MIHLSKIAITMINILPYEDCVCPKLFPLVQPLRLCALETPKSNLESAVNKMDEMKSLHDNQIYFLPGM